ncbi:ArsA family ATPase [Paraburkholderia sp. 31.1]|uniref:hypothetical protein n=1 Tax=Paraburkholderia sp. 31.1 TaxID=2615205 RepID=UPI0016560327|nr:hypothetical protein [Paraburkholderia sp. 31.1]MBC8726538.1 ArsA family ATPase [Paraburkholderia sp. 31.1]
MDSPFFYDWTIIGGKRAASKSRRVPKRTSMRMVITPEPMPLLVLAQRLYQDVGRYDTLVRQAAPVHPAFAPTAFSASLNVQVPHIR